ncbi:MAG: IPT/TIG domain-containing protein, partial [Bryobacteraceae bacterium]
MSLRKSPAARPQISEVSPHAAIAGGELQIRGKGFAKPDPPRVMIGDVGAPIVIGSDSFVIARVPDGATAGELIVESGKLARRGAVRHACDDEGIRADDDGGAHVADHHARRVRLGKT